MAHLSMAPPQTGNRSVECPRRHHRDGETHARRVGPPLPHRMPPRRPEKGPPEFREDRSRFPAVASVTALRDAQEGGRDKILARGFDGYISKPVTPERFVSEVEGFIAYALRTGRGTWRRS
jgi:hypothetical protein